MTVDEATRDGIARALEDELWKMGSMMDSVDPSSLM